MAGDEKEVVYRAIADFTNLYIEARRAEATIDSLGRKHATANEKIAQSEGKVTRSLDEHRKAETNLQQTAGRRVESSGQQSSWSPAAENALRQMRDIAERRARPRAEDYITPREPRGVWNDQAAYDELVRSETRVEKAARGAAEALRGQRDITREKVGHVEALTAAEGRQAEGGKQLAGAHRDVMRVLQQRRAQAAATAAEERVRGAAAGANAAEQRAGTAAEARRGASARADAAEEASRGASARASAAEEALRGASARATAAEHAESAARFRAQGAAHGTVAAAARADSAQEGARGAIARADTAEENLANARLRGEQIAVNVQRAQELLNQSYQRGEHAAVRMAQQQERAVADEARRQKQRIKNMDLGDLFTDTRQSFARGVRDLIGGVRASAQQRRTARPGIARGLALAAGDIPGPPDAAGAGGGGGGGSWGRFVSDLGDYAERISSIFGKIGKSLLSWRGLIVLAVAAAGPLISILGALGGVAIGAANGLVSLAGSVVALPGIFGAAAAAIGALAIALVPVAAAIKAYVQQQTQANLGTAQQADVMREAGAKVRDAQHSYEQGARAMVSAQYSEQRAQVSLNDARRQAFRDLQDLHNELARASLNERGSVLAIKQAESDYRKTLADSNATQLDREAAYLRVQNAMADHNELLLKNKRLQEDVTIADKRGVAGNLSVVDAQHAQAEAAQAVANAAYQQTKATQDLRQAQREYNAGGAQMLKANQALAAAMENLGPKTRIVVGHFFGMGGVFRALQRSLGDRIFGPLIGDLGRIDGMLPIVNDLLDRAATALGGVFKRGVEMATSGPWKTDFAELAKRNATLIGNFGDAGLSLADAFRNITVAAAPFTEWVSGAIKGLADSFDRWSDSARRSGSIVRFLETTKDRIRDVLAIGGNIFRLFSSLFWVSGEFTGTLFAGIVKVTAGWAEWGKHQEKSGSAFRTWLTNIKPLLHDVWGFVSSLVTSFARIAANPENIREAQRILRLLAYDVLPKLVTAFTTLSQSGIISGLVSGLGTFLGIADTALKILVTRLDWITNHHPAQAIEAIAVAFAGLAGVLVVGRFLGFFKLIDGVRWVVNNWGKFGQAFRDLVFGREPGGSGSSATRAAEKANPTKPGGYREIGTYTAQFDRVIGQLQEKITLEIEMNGLLRSMVGLLERGPLTRPAAPTPGNRYDPNGKTWPWVDGQPGPAPQPGEEQAATGLRGSATALDRAAEQLLVAAEQLRIAAGALRTSAFTNELPLPGRGGRGATAAERGLLREGESAVAGVGAKAGTSWWRRLLPGGRGAATAGEEAAGRTGGRLAGGLGAVFDPFLIPGMAMSFAADSGWLGKRGSLGKQFGQAGGAVLTGAGMGSVFGPAGTILGAAAGGVYSLAKDRGLRERITDAPGFNYTPAGVALRALGGSGRDPLGNIGHTMSQGWANMTSGRALDQARDVAGTVAGSVGSGLRTVGDSIGAFFTKTLPSALGRLPGQLDAHLLKPVENFFTRTLPHLLGKFAEFLVNLPMSLLKGFVVALGYIHQTAINMWTGLLNYLHRIAISSWNRLRKWWDSWSFAGLWHKFVSGVVRPIEHWFKNIVGDVRKWWNSWTFVELWSRFYRNVLTPIGHALRDLPTNVRKWWNSWTFVELWSRFYRNVLTPIGHFFAELPARVRTWWNSWTFAGLWSKFWGAVVAPIEKWAAGLGKKIGDWWNSWSFAGLWSKFYGSVVAPVVGWIKSIPKAIGDAFSDAWDTVKGWFKHGEDIANRQQKRKMSGGPVEGTYTGREDTEPHWLSIGEFVVRRSAAQRPGARAFLDDFNQGRFDPAALYAGLNASVRVPGAVTLPVSAAAPTIVNNTTSRGGLSTGDITINNPVRERAPHSLRRTLQSVAHRREW